MEIVRVNRPDHGPSEVVLDDVFCLDRSTYFVVVSKPLSTVVCIWGYHVIIPDKSPLGHLGEHFLTKLIVSPESSTVSVHGCIYTRCGRCIEPIVRWICQIKSASISTNAKKKFGRLCS